MECHFCNDDNVHLVIYYDNTIRLIAFKHFTVFSDLILHICIFS